MPTLNLLLSLCAFVAVTCIIIFLFFPVDAIKAKKKKKKKEMLDHSHKDWHVVAQRLEKYSISLKRETEKMKRERERMLRVIDAERQKNAKLRDKISQEDEWIKHGEETLKKKDEEIYAFEKSIKTIQQDLEKEYAVRLKLERELRTLQHEHKELDGAKRSLTIDLMHAKAGLKQHVQEVADLKKLTAELQKKNDEASWVSKKEFERLEKLLQQKDKEIERALRTKSPNE